MYSSHVYWDGLCIETKWACTHGLTMILFRPNHGKRFTTTGSWVDKDGLFRCKQRLTQVIPRDVIRTTLQIFGTCIKVYFFRGGGAMPFPTFIAHFHCFAANFPTLLLHSIYTSTLWSSIISPYFHSMCIPRFTWPLLPAPPAFVVTTRPAAASTDPTCWWNAAICSGMKLASL